MWGESFIVKWRSLIRQSNSTNLLCLTLKPGAWYISFRCTKRHTIVYSRAGSSFPSNVARDHKLRICIILVGGVGLVYRFIDSLLHVIRPFIPSCRVPSVHVIICGASVCRMYPLYGSSPLYLYRCIPSR